MKSLLGMSLSELQDIVAQHNMPKFTAKQLVDWLYRKRVTTFDEMTNLSKQTRQILAENYETGYRAYADVQESQDGTKKYLFPAENGFVETAYIPEKERATLCVSCQVGCKMNCLFCQTGKQGFQGNLSAGDIINQILNLPEYETLTNFVFMGMGEPMDNLDHVLRATEVLTAPWGLGWSPKRITVSTVGIIPGLERFLNESQCHVAVSLHNPFAAERQDVMPMQRAYPIADVIALLRRYDWSGQRRISFEYIMFRDLNDDTRHAAELVRLLKGLYCRVNLIRFHASPQTPYKTSSPQTIDTFRDYLNAHGVTCTLRASRGEDIMAACGLLAGQKKNG